MFKLSESIELNNVILRWEGGGGVGGGGSTSSHVQSLDRLGRPTLPFFRGPPPPPPVALPTAAAPPGGRTLLAPTPPA